MARTELGPAGRPGVDRLPLGGLSRPLEKFHTCRGAHILSHTVPVFPPSLGKTHLDVSVGCAHSSQKQSTTLVKVGTAGMLVSVLRVKKPGLRKVAGVQLLSGSQGLRDGCTTRSACPTYGGHSQPSPLLCRPHVWLRAKRPTPLRCGGHSPGLPTPWPHAHLESPLLKGTCLSAKQSGCLPPSLPT